MLKKEDIINMIINDYKNLVSQKQLQEMLMVADVLLEDETDVEKVSVLKSLGFNEANNVIVNREYNILNSNYNKFIVHENNFKFINLEFKVIDNNTNKKINRVMTYMYNQNNHNYDVILWLYSIKNNWFKRIFKRQPVEYVNLRVFYRGDISDELKQLTI